MKLEWDKIGDRFYETGVDHGVLFPMSQGEYVNGTAWNGLTAVNEKPTGAESNKKWADNIPYLNMTSTEEFAGSIEAYTYPDEFAECDGSVEVVPGLFLGQQGRAKFGMAYRTLIGNDVEGDDHGYKIHLVYGAQAAPSEKAYASKNDDPDAITLSWEFTTTPVAVTGHRPVAHLEIDSTKTTPEKLAKLEEMLYGTEMQEPKLPLPDEVITLLTAEAASVGLG